ncbi:carbohydrate ABC transporter permease [Curtobacterium sp. VKM Ac-1376]|uniref:carbohydrate ABC transporter permease n=1 Tax=Curtobacterium sp. VKM Ac-1376 TaxID=123312 RepID=UPI001E610E22|nr:carbohydrate ABC transporter permease [Curtobacterium sp. VKM Ac-1376]
MIVISCVVAIPFYYLLVNTFKTQQETTANPLGLPSSLYLGNYISVFESTPIVQSFFNTVYVTVISIVLMLVVGSMAAFGVLIGRGRIAQLLGVVLIVAFLIPGQSTLIPLYKILSSGHLVDSLNGLIVMYMAGSIFCYILIIGYMRTIPKELFEAARIDGAGAFRIYWSVALPLIRPILATVGVFQTMWVWNDFITPNVFINSPSRQTLVLQVYSAVGQFTTNWPVFITLSVIALVPMVIFFAFTQRQIVSGLINGGLK